MADGGLVKNLPVDVARQMGAQRIIAVNIGTPLTPRKDLRSLLSVSQQMINILTEQNVTAQKALLGPQDVLISPDLVGFSFLDFAKVADLIRIGEAATRPLEAGLAALAVPPEQYAQWRASRAELKRVPTATEFVEVSPLQVVPPQAVLNAAGFKPGQSLTAADIQAAVGRVQEMGDFERVSISAQRQGQAHGVRIDAKEKFWGPHYLRVGLDASIDFTGESSISLRLGHLRTWLNDAGAQWRNRLDLGRVNGLSTELFQPLSLNSPGFVSAGLGVQSYQKPLYANGKPLLTGRVRELRASLEVGAELSQQSDLRLGASRKTFRATGDLNYLSSAQTLVTEDVRIEFAENDIYLRYTDDSLDNAFLPSSGQRLILQGGQNQSDDTPADTKVELRWTGAFTLGHHTLWPALRLARARSSVGQGTGAFALGGFLEMSGLPTESLSGSRLGFVRLAYLNRISTGDVLGRRLLLGGSVELGNVWDSRPDLGYTRDLLKAGSIFVTAESPLGPLFLGVGRTAGRGTTVYLFLGQP
ncbi:MAG: hypothetical protein C4K60_16845 [Ideonella sp. MAG2]|nr:MAG: hypothetical protein C4K60_16845 [Ideonella sp. MAG2]